MELVPANPAETLAAPADPPQLPGTVKQLRLALWTMASELIVDLGYTYRAHFIVGQRMRSKWWAKALVFLRAVLPVSATAGTAAFALFGLKDLAVVLGFGAALVLALERAFNPIGEANAHSDKGDRLLTVYKDIRYFRRAKILGPAPAAELEQQFAQLRKRADDLRMVEPRQLPGYAYDEARRQINDQQSEYVGDPLWQDAPEDLR